MEETVEAIEQRQVREVFARRSGEGESRSFFFFLPSSPSLPPLSLPPHPTARFKSLCKLSLSRRGYSRAAAAAAWSERNGTGRREIAMQHRAELPSDLNKLRTLPTV